MASTPAISVVAPIYKVEKYLRDCVESVLAQNFTDFELILVDDGSPDKCGEICDELAKKDPRIRVFHQQNGGVTSARRLGVEHARGEWIYFLDADDLLPKDALKNLIAEASDDVDWVQGGGWQEFKDGETPKVEPRTGNVTSLDLVDLVENMLLYYRGPFAKLVRQKLFTPHVFEIPREIRVSEDVLMNTRLITNRPRKPKKIDKIVYFYRQQDDSVTHTYLRTEGYILRYMNLMLTEVRAITGLNHRRRLLFALSRSLRWCMTDLIIYGLPIKFPHRLAILMWPVAKATPRGFFICLCLRFGCPSAAQTVARICHFLHGVRLDASKRTLLEWGL